jgi:lysozyme
MARQPSNRGRSGKDKSRPGGTAALAAIEPEPPAPPLPPDKDGGGVGWLADLLDRAIKHVPYVRYAFGLVGVAAAAAIVVVIFRLISTQFGENSILGMFVLTALMIVFMFVLFLFSNFEDRNRRFLQLPAKIVAWLSVLIVVGLVGVATSVGLAKFPPHIYDAVFAKAATDKQKVIRDKFKSRPVYALRCNDFARESDYEYVEDCVLSGITDFFQECSGFTPVAPDDEEQVVDDFACLDPDNRRTADGTAPTFAVPHTRFAALFGPSDFERSGAVVPVQSESAPPCGQTLLGRRLRSGQADSSPVLGFDISHHSKEVPWDALIEEGNVFVIMKATEGRGFDDPAFLRNWKEAGRRGLLRGAYHVMRYGQNVRDQIQFFESVTAAAEHRACDFGPALDLQSAARGKPIQDRDLVAIREWLQWSEKHFGQPVMLFSNTLFLESYLDVPEDLLSRGVLWLQDFGGKEPRPPAGYSGAFLWQFSDGKLNAPQGPVSQPVDRNRFTGSASEFVRELRLRFE